MNVTITLSEAENAVAIMDCIGFWPNDNEAILNHLSGRKGVYQLVLDLGVALEAVVSDWEDWDWYLTTEAIADKVGKIEDVYGLPHSDKAHQDFVRDCLRA